ncbi:MAG: alpha/beta fold hydrolase [Actinomycetota bacterium]|nr:alpha/beta fold hydrolase [Actinomycetota bacterium]
MAMFTTPPFGPRDQRRGRGARRAVQMVPGQMHVAGRRVHFAVSNNEAAVGPDGPGSPPIWAVNIHGYFAGGSMYWRESAHLAERLGWRVVNPCLPGFAGSDPLPGTNVDIEQLASAVTDVLDHVGAGPCVVLGHSMGGAVAMAMADAVPERVLGVIYRDGVATPAWRARHGLLVGLIAPTVPDLAGMADLVAAVLLDFPDMLIGRRPRSTLRMTIPDARRNLLVTGQLVPIASMLLHLDLSETVARVAARGMPVLPEWGCFDRIATPAAAAEVSALAGRKVVWVPGGHSWMLPRPQGQADVLSHLPAGQEFLAEITERWRTSFSAPAGARSRPRIAATGLPAAGLPATGLPADGLSVAGQAS